MAKVKELGVFAASLGRGACAGLGGRCQLRLAGDVTFSVVERPGLALRGSLAAAPRLAALCSRSAVQHLLHLHAGLQACWKDEKRFLLELM